MGAVQHDRSRVSLRGRKNSRIYVVDEDGYLRDQFGEFVQTKDDQGRTFCVTTKNRGIRR